MRIFPTNKLLVLTALIVFPGTLGATFLPFAKTSIYAVMTGFFALSVLDAVLSMDLLSAIDVTFPDVVRLTCGKQGDLSFDIRHNPDKASFLRVGLCLPSGLLSLWPGNAEDRHVSLQKSTEKQRVSWPLLGKKQGRHVLTDLRLEKPSKGGFWAVREKRVIRTEVRVYPDLSPERKSLASLFLERGTGVHRRKMIGKGREFEKLREYAPGDSYEDIHWKATARRGIPISKVFQVERTQDVYVLIDASRMSGRNAAVVGEMEKGDERRNVAVREETMFERYVASALVLALAAEKQGDRFGMGVFADTMMGFVKARNGKSHFNTCRDLVHDLSHQRVSPDFSEFFTFTATRIRKRSLLFILTSLEDPVIAESFLAHVHVLSRKHLVVVMMVKPASAHSLFDRKAKDPESVHDIHSHLAGHVLWAGLKELERSLYRQGVGFVVADNLEFCRTLVNRYLSIKQRQVL